MTRKETRRRRISPALVISVAAMFAALSGAAVALPGSNTVNSGDIIDQKVKARDLKTASVKADELSDGIQPRANSVSVSGGTGENGAYLTEQVTATCAPGEELISGSGHWNNSPDEELFLQEVFLNHDAEAVTVAGGNDSGINRTLIAVAHCLEA
jgi:hypothetical protein